MRSPSKFLLPLLLAGSLLSAGFRNAPYLTGDEIMQKVKETHGTDAEIDLIKMVAVTSTGETVTRQFISAAQKDAKGNFLYLLRFTAPEDQKGTALLVLEKDGGDSDQYLYLPALGKATQIEGSAKAGSFMGSDFTYEDMRKEKPGEWIYNRLLDDNIDGADYYAIESKPVNNDREKITGYTTRIVYVDKTTYDIRRIEFFDSKNQPIKVFDVYDYQPTNDKAQRPRRGVMVNKAKNTTTTLVLQASILNKPLDPKFFTLDTLKNWGPDQEKIVQDLMPKDTAAKPEISAGPPGARGQ